MKAQNEGEALEHMILSAENNNLSGWADAWQKLKTAQLARASSWWEINRPRSFMGEGRPLRVLELGVGDLTHLRGWGAFRTGAIEYTGVDFVPEVISKARAEFPQHRWINLAFSEVEAFFDEGETWDLILLLDVLYHIPSAAVYSDVLDFAFTRAILWVMLTHATDMSQIFNGGKRPGDAGFCWFPRPFEIPTGPEIDEFEISFEAEAKTPQRQTFKTFERL
jgi:hypothetical protein